MKKQLIIPAVVAIAGALVGGYLLRVWTAPEESRQVRVQQLAEQITYRFERIATDRAGSVSGDVGCPAGLPETTLNAMDNYLDDAWTDFEAAAAKERVSILEGVLGRVGKAEMDTVFPDCRWSVLDTDNLERPPGS